jgi:hypothetical protein
MRAGRPRNEQSGRVEPAAGRGARCFRLRSRLC